MGTPRRCICSFIKHKHFPYADLFATPHPNLPSREGTRADAQLAHSPRPIIAPTSQVGEVAVVRTSVSYKCGWGLNKTNPHPNLPQLGKECAYVARLAHIPRPLKITSLRGNIHSARSNPERITQLKTVDISLNCNEKFTINQQIRFSK